MPVDHRHVLVPTDFSDQSRASLLVARDYAEQSRARLTIAHVLHTTQNLFGDGVYASDATRLELESAADVELRKLLVLLDAPNLTTACIVLHGAPHEQIPRYARENGVDLIVIGTHGRSGVASVVFGSVTQRVIVASPCPLLVLPPRPAT